MEHVTTNYEYGVEPTNPIDPHCVIDPNTGEILSEPPADADTDRKLSQYARMVRTIRAERERLESYMKAEVERLTAITTRKIESITRTEEFLLSASENILAVTGKKKMDYPGLGSFRFRKLPDVVDDTAYNEMPEERKAQLQQMRADIFTTKTVIAPNKKYIKELLVPGGALDGFALVTGRQKFEMVDE